MRNEYIPDSQRFRASIFDTAMSLYNKVWLVSFYCR